MHLKDIYYLQLNSLNTIYDENEAKSILKILYEFFFNEHFYKIYSFFNTKILSSDELNRLNCYFSKLMQNTPIQYVTNEVLFYNRVFFVNNNVLIPRGETEELCNLIISDYDRNINISDKLNVLDIGTGSGCIAITLCLENKNFDVYAIDFSKDALEVAEKNNKLLCSNVSFFLDDILVPKYISKYKFDIIVSNPPYVLESEKGSMHKNVIDYEPENALFVSDNNPLLYYDAIVNFALNNLKKDGVIYLEINPLVANKMVNKYRTFFKNINLIKDINNKDRFLVLKF
ncbi:MAG: N5-glutamine methyltransferase family protein [Bacteroidales bacterium]